jgi:hypothetical protein
MSNLFPIQDRILKIFTPVRCLNRDQLPRYIDNKMTPVEKHLVEQHLIDCDLCYHALQSLEKASNREPYEHLTTNTITYIHQNYMPAPKNVVQQKAIRKGRKQESLLAYFWTLAIIGFIGGGIYIVQAAMKHRSLRSHTMTIGSTPANGAVSQTPADVTYSAVNVSDEPPASAASTAQHAVATSDTARKIVKPAAKTDTMKLVATAPQATTPKRDSATAPAPKKTVLNDSVTRPAPAPVAEKKPEVKEEPKATPPPAAKEEKPVAASPKSTVNIDESLYKSALMLQQQGDLDQAIERYKKVSGGSKFGELAKYQMAVCYKNRGQSGKAKKLFKEVVKMDGSMKVAAQNALDN